MFAFALFLLCVGLFYSGWSFISHLKDGIATGSVVGSVDHMRPGDHHEQFYRYSLVYENLVRGNMPYFTGYQYASTDFTEGLIFFPFTAIVGLLSFVFGPILSYNLLLIFSYVFVGLAGYYMVKQITKSTAAGFVSGLFLATVPFRTSFLYGQMLFGVDAVMIPLLIYIIERAKETGLSRYFFLIGLLMFLMVTANFQLFYWAMLLLSPYFLYAIFFYFHNSNITTIVKIKGATWLIPGLIGCLIYGIYVFLLMKNSALQGGQNFNELLNYTPELYRLFIKFNGNEKNVYLGLTALLVLPWTLLPLLRYRSTMSRSPYIPLFFALFIIGMWLVFGPFIDLATKLPIYRWLFDHVPGINGTRTTGRLMSVVVIFYAILLGFFVEALASRLTSRFSRTAANATVAGILVAIVLDFNYLKPGINTFEQENQAYTSIAGTRAKVVTLPFQSISNHHYNSTFLTYALKYDIRLFTGHSSFYPKVMDEHVSKMYSLNDGFIDHSQWKWLIDNDYKHIIAHATEFMPNVSLSTIAALRISPYLEFLKVDNGVYLFNVRKIDANNTAGAPGAIESVDYETWGGAIESLPTTAPWPVASEVQHAYGWYTLETYPNQRPFRWMKGVDSILVLNKTDKSRRTVSFDFHCPNHQPLKIGIHRAKGNFTQEKLSDGWHKAEIIVHGTANKVSFISLQASKLFEAPPDIRKFGCQVGDISIH